MSSARPSMHVELVDARCRQEDRDWLTHVYPLYLHDLSVFDDGYYRLDERGLWQPDYLPSWLSPDSDQPLLICADGDRIGFGLVNCAPSPHVAEGLDLRLSEFFILRRFRRRGCGRLAALALFERFKGRWEVRQLARNTPATSFWRKVIGDYTGGHFREQPIDGNPRQVFASSTIRREQAEQGFSR